MLVITSDVRNEIDDHALELAFDVLNDGGVIAYATDTCYGFSCDATKQKAVDRLRFMKQMPVDKPVSLIFDSMDHVMRWVRIDDRGLTLAAKYWPGNLTIVANKRVEMKNREYANKGIDTIGCRIPACVFSHKLVENCGFPITTTSANISGLPSTYSAYDIIKQFENAELKPDLVIDSGVIPKNAPSTVVDLSGSEVRVLRAGVVAV